MSFKFAAMAAAAAFFLTGAASCSNDDDAFEAQIESATLKSDAVLGNPKISGTSITFYVATGTDITALAPEFTLSAGATILPASGVAQDFSKPVEYTVTSADGMLVRTYTVSVRTEAALSNNLDEWSKIQTEEGNDKSIYYTPSDADWSTANIGNVLLRAIGYNLKNTVDVTTDAHQGTNAAIIRTEFVSDKPVFGMNTPIASGSLYLGNFTTGTLMTDPMKCTEFGVPITRKPVKVEGYYKYLPGEVFTDEKYNVIAGAKDSCAIYAVVFKGKEPLNGRNVLTSDRIIAKAVIKDGAKPAYTKFELNLDYKSAADLAGDLMFTIVCSSSWDGNIFKGAVGSTLYVDDIKVTTEYL